MVVDGHGGSIINISSVALVAPHPTFAAYAGAKAALNTLTIAQAIEFAPDVRVNAILPGSFRTDLAAYWPPTRKRRLLPWQGTSASLGKSPAPRSSSPAIIVASPPER